MKKFAKRKWKLFSKHFYVKQKKKISFLFCTCSQTTQAIQSTETLSLFCTSFQITSRCAISKACKRRMVLSLILLAYFYIYFSCLLWGQDNMSTNKLQNFSLWQIRRDWECFFFITLWLPKWANLKHTAYTNYLLYQMKQYRIVILICMNRLRFSLKQMIL